MLAVGALTAGLLAFMAFRAGGYFPDTTGLVTLAGLAVLLGVATATPRPLATLRPRLLIGVGALAVFALWTLISSSWSDAPGRAVIEFGRVLLYVVVLLGAGLVVDRPARARALVLGVLAGLAAACVAGLIARTLPDVFTIPADVANQRLGWPVTYWNALGVMAVSGIVLAFGLTSSSREHTAVRVVTAALVPPLCATLLFTFSRGSIAAGAAGLLLTMLLSRQRALLTGALAVVVPAAVAVVAAYEADALARPDPTGAQAASQGHNVLLVVALCALAAGVLRWLLIRHAEPRIERRPPAPRWTRYVVAGLLVALAAGAVGVGASQYDRFVHGTQIQVGQDQRSRLTDPGNNGRLDHWRVSMDGFRAEPVHGTGAGTYPVEWDQHRDAEFSVLNAHSLYVETLGELGLVGLALLLGALGMLLFGLIARARGEERALWAATAGAVVAWSLEAGVDWIWQMPAATAWVFALGGAALARDRRPADEAETEARPSSTARLLAGLAVLLVAITPVRVALSQAHLRTAVSDLRRGDCNGTIASALDAASVLSARSESYVLLAYCDARIGLGNLGEQMARRAIAHDPHNWQYHYALGVVQASQGRDPRPAIAQARRLNPLDGMLIRFERSVSKADPQAWKRRAQSARLLLP
ncbi:MAG: O-antigen ligase family protein [Solirubrobacteraceae bacterium]